MKRKNGFTLIELLAIIVILAIIAVITVPIILNIIDNAEKGSAQDSALGYKDALQKYYATKSVQNPEQELPSGYMEISELPSDFTVSGENPSDGWVKLKNGIVEKYSLKYKDYVVTMDNDKNITSQKQDKVDPHVTNDYKEVEYLESTGTQYIDTGYVPQQNDYLELRNVTRKSEGALFSAGTGDYQLIYLIVGSTNYFKNFATGSASYFVLDKFNNSNIKVSNNNLYINDQLYVTSDPIGDVNTDLRLFARKSDTNYINAQIGNVIIKNDNKIVRNLVPVMRKSDGKPGMLDLANLSNNLFTGDYSQFTSTGGSGTLYAYFGVEDDFVLSLKAKNDLTVPNGVYIGLTKNGGDATGGYRWAVSQNQVFKKDDVVTIKSTDKGYQYVSMYTPSESTLQTIIDNFEIMLNKGTEELPYEPYTKSFYTNEGTGEFIAGPEI